MVLAARSAFLLSSRSSSLLSSLSRVSPCRTALRSYGSTNPSLLNKGTFTKTAKFGPLVSTRLLTSGKREKVKVLAVLYDGGKHAEEVRDPPFFSTLLSPPIAAHRRCAAMLAKDGRARLSVSCRMRRIDAGYHATSSASWSLRSCSLGLRGSGDVNDRNDSLGGPAAA
jgi:hypothetical protein